MASFPSLTNTWHRDSYPAIDPRRWPELSLRGKTVVITGGGTGVGKGLTRAFADAGAARVAILGRREDKLKGVESEVEAMNTGSKVTTHATDVTNIESVKNASRQIGRWDVLVSNAGYLPSIASVTDVDPEDWWTAFEVNVKGLFNLAHAFLPNRNPGAVLIGINAGSWQVPQMSAKWSGYNASKVAACKLVEDIGMEYPDLHVVSLHPGVVQSEMTLKTGVDSMTWSTPELAGHTAVWLCSDEARFLRGRFIWTNWDADELKQKKNEIENSSILTVNCIGWPYAPYVP